MSILLATHSLIKDTHLHMQHTQRGVLILHAAIALRQQILSAPTKRFIKASKKGRLRHFPPKKLWFGKVSVGIWIQISWVICYELSLAIRINLQTAVFSLMWLMCVFESYGRTTTAGN